LLFVLLAIVLASTLVKSTKPYRKYQMVLVAVIVGLIIYTYTKKKFADIRTNTIEGNAANNTEILLVINVTANTLTWATNAGSAAYNAWRTTPTPVPTTAVKSIAPNSYQLFNYDPNFSIESFFYDGFTNYKNNNNDLAYVIYDLTQQVVSGATKYTMYIAFASVNNCPGCSALIDSLNKGPSGAGYNMFCDRPRHNANRFEFEDSAGASASYNTPACPAGATSPNIVYYNALPPSAPNGGIVEFQKFYPTTGTPVKVTLTRTSSVAMSTLYSIGTNLVTEGTPQPPSFSSPPEADITYVYNRYRGLLIESVSTVSGSPSNTNRRTVTYRSLSPL
jgi:hypothetical protein